ncbi:hypothetical protein OSB04_028279 [Centaurea solstitialis]|uniref:Uncharacterized protein n=1 Tax=Centaurea solstitialis TaxID=347529 RepID=A0AA38SMU2_9ASTR|nr:hypothetical protein OSB04_028279 [Centaurea solstitialis]
MPVAIAKVGNKYLAAVQAYDTATESIEAINAAELKFQDIINSPSVDADINGGQPTSKSLILRSTQLILCTIKGLMGDFIDGKMLGAKMIEFLEFRPSEIAAAVATYVVGSTQVSALVQKVLEAVERKSTEKGEKT